MLVPFKLRVLLIALAALAGGFLLVGVAWFSLPTALGLAAAVLAAWVSFWPERKFRREVESRESLDEDRFFNEFYAETGIPSDIPRRLRPIYCKFFDIEPGKLRPHDWPPEIADIDTVDLVRDIEKEFRIAISFRDAEQIDGSFDSIVRYLAEHLPVADVKG